MFLVDSRMCILNNSQLSSIWILSQLKLNGKIEGPNRMIFKMRDEIDLLPEVEG